MKGASTLAGFSYTYANGGSDTGLRQSVADNVSGVTTSYTSDPVNRLTRASSPSANYQ